LKRPLAAKETFLTYPQQLAAGFFYRCHGWAGNGFKKVMVSKWHSTGLRKSDGLYRDIETPELFLALKSKEVA
jgi:hypothetical protein